MVVCWVRWPLSRSEAGAVWHCFATNLLFVLCNCGLVCIRITWFTRKSSEVCIRTRSPQPRHHSQASPLSMQLWNGLLAITWKGRCAGSTSLSPSRTWRYASKYTVLSTIWYTSPSSSLTLSERLINCISRIPWKGREVFVRYPHALTEPFNLSVKLFGRGCGRVFRPFLMRVEHHWTERERFASPCRFQLICLVHRKTKRKR